MWINWNPYTKFNQKIPIKNVQRSWIDPSLKIYLWPMNVYKRMMKSLDMQIKTTMTYHLLEWLSSKRQGLTSWWGHEEWELLCTVDGDGNWCSHYGNSMQIPLKTKNRTTYDPAIPLLGTQYKALRNFPGGPVVKNPAANAGNMGSLPGQGKSHRPQSN